MRILVPLAEGFEELEAVTIVDVLRRAELDVTVAGLSAAPCRGSRGVVVVPDTALDQVDPASFDAIVLPGGLGGTLALAEDEGLLAALRAAQAEGRWVAAICAAPLVLARAGTFAQVPKTAHPSVAEQLAGESYTPEPRVLRSGRVITSQGPGTALEFALELVEAWVGPEARASLAAAMVV